MQFAVPQFTEVEDRLIGSLTLKQFLVMLAAGGVILVFWTALGPGFLFFMLAIPIALFGVAMALGKYNGRPLFTYLMPFAAFVSSTKLMVFRRETNVTSVSRWRPAEDKGPQQAAPDLEPAESRLKKLAYLMDSKTEEEIDIISRDSRQDIVVPSASKVDLGTAMARAATGVREQVMATARQLDGKPAQRDPSPVMTRAPLARPVSAARQTLPPRQPDGGPASKNFDPSSFLQI